MKDILTTLIKSIVDAPDAVNVEENDDNGFVTLTITVAPDDMGKVIGKEGKVIRALRNVMKIPAMKQGKKVQISLAE